MSSSGRDAAVHVARQQAARRDREKIFAKAIIAEYEEARDSYRAMVSTHEGYGVILEELDEAWDEIKANNFEASCNEMIQVAAMALAYLVDLTDPARSKQ